MDDASRPTWSIGGVARQTGLPVKVVRHWSDVGVVTPVGRTVGVARLQLARTLRDLGMGLGEIRAALGREDGLTEVAAAHVGPTDLGCETGAANRMAAHRTDSGHAHGSE